VALDNPNNESLVRRLHYTSWADDIKQLRRDGNVADAEQLLLECVDAVESESRAEGWGVAPWYYEQLAILYHKEKRAEMELEILRRYASQSPAPGVKPQRLMDRLAKLEA
jgi:hypothetical protein